MNDSDLKVIETQQRINTLVEQRNTAHDFGVILSGRIAVLEAQIGELRMENDQLKQSIHPPQSPEGS